MGENGAGKTTLIKHILGLYRPEAGTVRVLGRDPAADPVGVLSQVGYLSEFLDLPLWMRVGELMRYSGAFYRTWDADYAEALRCQLDLNPAARLGNLSKGQQAKAGLLVALAFRPDLLVLDEPSSGLDPVARRDILETLLRSASEQGRTVFFSSHLLDEVERIANRVAMIHRGRLVLCGNLSEIHQSHHYARVRFESAPVSPPRWNDLLEAKGAGRDWELSWAGSAGALPEALMQGRLEVLERRPMTLDEIFLARIRQTEQ
jgi:ABC-2 type transport system ATP-binding protein